MKLRDVQEPIVSSRWPTSLWFQHRSALSEHFLSKWQEAGNLALPSFRSQMEILSWQLEAWLQVTNSEVPRKVTKDTFPAYERVFKRLFVALHCPHFCGLSPGAVYRYASSLIHARKRLAEVVGANLSWNLSINSKKVDPQLEELVKIIGQTDVDPLKVKIWQGWVCKKLANHEEFSYLPLTPVLERLGEEFAVGLYNISATYAAARRGENLHGVRVLASYIASSEEKITRQDLEDPNYTTDFFYGVYEHFLQEKFRGGDGARISTIVSLWRGSITAFFEDVLFPSGLVAAPNGGLPRPRNIGVMEGTTNLVETDDGLVHEKLLTHVPLNVSDDEALKLIFNKVEHDIILIKEWAWHIVQHTAQKLQRRQDLAKIGTVRQLTEEGRVIGSTDWSHVHHLRNAAATFDALVYPCYCHGSTLSTQYFPAPRAKWVEELALPTLNILIAHCAVIVAEHPSITPSFLDGFELYDKSDRLCGIKVVDGSTILIGAKRRRGASLASQEVVLNERSKFAVEQLCEITKPMRDFLRSKGDANWRFLFLSAHKGLGYPRPVKSFSKNMSGENAANALKESFLEVLTAEPKSEIERLANRFSLSSLRASVAVQVYFDTQSVQKMSDALGHRRYESKLLDRYLPRSIRQFFEERWIRIFQAGIIVQALEGSEYRLKASGFRSIDELEQFLFKHALRLPEESKPRELDLSDPWAAGDVASPNEVVFGLNEEILTTLLSLGMAEDCNTRPLLPKARYWAAVGRELIPYVERVSSARPDLMHFLGLARANAQPSLVEALAYEP